MTLDDLTLRAIKLHTGRVPGAQQPAANQSGPATAGGLDYVVLRNVSGVLAVYRVGTIPYLLYAASRAEVHALRRDAENRPTAPHLTRADTTALWYAVQAQSEVIDLRLRDGFTLDQMEPERVRLFAARAALRKVNQIRKVQMLTAPNSAKGCPDG